MTEQGVTVDGILERLITAGVTLPPGCIQLTM